jgi:hypothetical protein
VRGVNGMSNLNEIVAIFQRPKEKHPICDYSKQDTPEGKVEWELNSYTQQRLF